MQQAYRNSLAADQGMLTQFEMIAGVLQLTVFIACEASFQDHSTLADYASTISPIRWEMTVSHCT